MGLLSAVIEVFSGNKNAVRLDVPPGTGAAVGAVRSLITHLCQAASAEVRNVSTEDYLEAVIRREQLDEYCRILGEALGPAAKPFDQRATFTGLLEKMVQSRGGIQKDQCLHLRRYDDDHVAFAALWPWADPEKITLKVGIYDQKLPPETAK